MAYSGANPAESLTSTLNSTTVALAANGVFTGSAEDITIYSSITVSLTSNVVSATDGLQIQQSTDGTSWDFLDVYSIPAANGKTFASQKAAKFCRIVYTNGPTVQASFKLQTIFNKFQASTASVRPQDGRSNDNDFGEELAFLMAYNSITNTWNRVGIANANTGGNETAPDRLKVNASLRMIDAAQPVGAQLVGATGTQALGLTVNTVDRATRQLGISSIKGLAIAPQSTPFAAATTGATTGFDVSAAGNVAFIIKNTVAATAWTGTPTIVFEQSDDNVSWALLLVVRNDTSLSASTHTLPVNTANTEYMFDTAAEGVSFVRARITTGTTTGGITIGVQPGSLPFSPSVTAILNTETTKVIGRVGIDQSTPGTTNAIQAVPGTTNGLIPFNLVSAATTNATVLKASAGQVYGWYIYNSNIAARKITFHNSAAAPTAGAGVFFSLVIPPGSGANVHMGTGISFSAGIGITTTTGLAATDAVAVALNDLVINIFYK